MTQNPYRIRRRRPWQFYCKAAVITLVSAIVLVVFVYPLVYTVLNSLKTYDDFENSTQGAYMIDPQGDFLGEL